MPPYWDRVTPALYGITRRIARPIILDKWENYVVPILHAEQMIYERVFYAFAFVRSMNHNSACGLEVFRILLSHDGLKFEHDPLPSAVFDAYWDLAEDGDYWQPGHHAEIGQHLPYDQVLQRWEDSNQTRTQWVGESLTQWLNAN